MTYQGALVKTYGEMGLSSTDLTLVHIIPTPTPAYTHFSERSQRSKAQKAEHAKEKKKVFIRVAFNGYYTEMREYNFKGFHIIVAWIRILVVFPVWLLNLVPKANFRNAFSLSHKRNAMI